MSQGLTWIAGRRTPLLALVAIFALSVGMFSAFSPTRAGHADDALGDVKSNSGTCLEFTEAGDTLFGLFHDGDDEGDEITSGATDPQVMVYVEDATPTDMTDEDSIARTEGDQPGFAAITTALCEADDDDESANVNRNFKITPNGTETPIIELLSPTVSIGFSDSDAVIGDDVDLDVTIKTSNFNGYGSANTTPVPVLVWARVSGVLDITVTTADVFAANDNSVSATVEIPAGSPEGEYTVSARVRYDVKNTDQDATDDKVITVTKQFTVGDPGSNAASATLSLGNAHDEDPLTSANDVVAEDGTEAANGGDIWLRLTVSNSLGEAANGGQISTITVIAPGATLSVHPSTPAGIPGAAVVAAVVDGPAATVGLGSISGGTNSISVSDDADSGTADLVGRTMFVKVGRAGSPPAPGTVTVYALVIGTDGAPRSEDVDVIFTGSAAVVVLGDDTSVGKPAEGAQAQTEISLGAQDTGGNDSTLGTVIYAVKDADDKPVSQTKVKAETSTAGSSTDKLTDDGPAAVVLVTVDDSADAGVYTIEASLNGVDDSSDTATVTVSGAADNVDLAASQDSSDTIGDVITVTATITDADGNTIADGQLVTFGASGDGLVQIGTDADGDSPGMQSKTKNGEASAKFAVTGAGTSVVSAVIGSQTAVVVVVSTAGATSSR